EVQSLLEPVVVELPPALDAVYQEVREPIQQSGFVLEPFGERSYLVRGTPAALGQADPRQTLIEALEYLGSRESRDYPWEERIALSYVCHHVVRAGRVMTPQEMDELVLKLEQTAVPHTCPHGRPTTIHLSQTQLEHEFGRR
ncbi:MAG: DNA mismatch repair protein MutL, partial [Chloroflexi bacterium]|nr:DNA mismatch repair protein MutL [Chloroflexota bacterium]